MVWTEIGFVMHRGVGSFSLHNHICWILESFLPHIKVVLSTYGQKCDNAYY
jgi:hypothetical protein